MLPKYMTSALFERTNRRQLLSRLACGFGALATSGLFGSQISPPLPPRVKRVIFLFMQGGVSQVDSFDYKPLLEREHGKLRNFADARSLAKTGKGGEQRIMKSLWDFRQRGQCGLWVSELFPEIARHADDLCVLRSMETEGVAHGPATLFLHTGSTNFVRPSLGAWLSYGLGSENSNLPGFVSISPSMGNGGPRNYGNAFLPARHQGTPIGRSGQPAAESGIRFLDHPERSREEEAAKMDLVRQLNQSQTSAHGGRHADQLDAMFHAAELAWKMQTQAPDTLDISQESEATKKLYGIGEPQTDNYGRQCLMARRLAESGVRFIQVNYGDNSNNPAWDQHSDLPKHEKHARATDKPVAGLLADLKARGLLEDTLVWWGGEFGRTPYAEKNGTGRDHNPGGFSVWLAGAGVKKGHAHGETDEYGHRAISDRVHMHDLHATILHLLGLDHEKLTFRHDGRDFRLTDVYGRIIQEILT